MERTLAAFSAIVLLIGCFTGCGMSDEPKKIRIPDITFMYTNSFEDTYAMWFCDSAASRKNGARLQRENRWQSSCWLPW